MIKLNSPVVPSSRPPINLSQLMSQDTLMLTSRTPGPTSTRTTRDGSDTKRPTPSRDISKVTSTSSPTPQDLSLIFPQEDQLIHSTTHSMPRASVLDTSEE